MASYAENPKIQFQFSKVVVIVGVAAASAVVCDNALDFRRRKHRLNHEKYS